MVQIEYKSLELFICLQLKTSKNKESVQKITEVAVSHQLTIAHVDLSEKLQEADRAEKERLFKKVDKWCDKVYQHVSINGMCVIVFAGPKSVPKSPPDNAVTISDSSSSTMNSSESDPSSSSSSVLPVLPNPNQPPKKPKKQRPRENGVCFVRINTLKI